MGFEQTILDVLETADEGFIPTVLAEKLVANCDGVELDEWLHERAAGFVCDRMRQLLQVDRKVQAHRARARAFGRAVQADGGFDAFAVVYRVDDENTVKRLAHMTSADLRFVAAGYARHGNRQLMLAAFHEYAAKRVGRRTVGEVFTVEQWESSLADFERRLAS